jgi:hypothetical protein
MASSERGWWILWKLVESSGQLRLSGWLGYLILILFRNGKLKEFSQGSGLNIEAQLYYYEI